MLSARQIDKKIKNERMKKNNNSLGQQIDMKHREQNL